MQKTDRELLINSGQVNVSEVSSIVEEARGITSPADSSLNLPDL